MTAIHELINLGLDDQIAFYDKKPLTYRQLRSEVAAYRQYFYNQGIRGGDNVGLFARNSVEFIYSYMAVVSLGAVIVPLNFQLTAREVAYIIQDAAIKCLITREQLPLADELVSYGYQQPVRQLMIHEIAAILPDAEISAQPLIDERQPCAIIYTSGTTGNPKGAVLSHSNLYSNAQAVSEVFEIKPHDIVLCVLPMYHAFAWTCAVLSPLLTGASIAIVDGFTPKETVLMIRKYAVNVVYGVPPMYNLFSRTGEASDLAGVRLFVSGGASLPETVAVQFKLKYGVAIVEGYGLSEASPVVAANPLTACKVGSIGKPLPGVTVKIVDDQGQPLPIGTVGELAVKGPNVMQGYYNLPTDTARALQAGWLFTGDLAYQDQDGYLFVVDRLKDMIIANGENVYPREIEELIYTIPGVVEAAVIGVPDVLRGQAVRAYLVLEPGIKLDKRAIRDYLTTRLAAYKLPRDYVQVQELPKNQTGKILKRVLREPAKTDSN